MDEITKKQHTVMARMKPGIWYKAGDLVDGGLGNAATSRILRQLTAQGLVAQELTQGGSRCYEYRLTCLGLKHRAQVKSSRYSPSSPSLEARLADWKMIGRGLGRWLKAWLREFIP